jgi:gas vesicle protein
MNNQTEPRTEKTSRKNQSNEVLKAGLTGAVIGATAGAATVLLTDKTKREKLSKTVKNGIEQVRTKAAEINEMAENTVNETKAAVEQLNKKKQNNKKK